MSVAASRASRSAGISILLLAFMLAFFSALAGGQAITFAAPASYPTGTPGASNAFDVVAADFNRDGLIDLAVTNPHNLSNNVSILLNAGGGVFSPAVNFSAGDAPLGIATGDFNRDGNPDLVVANENSSNFSLLLGNGAGGFAAPLNFFAGNQPFDIAVGDFNRDGNPDVAVANAAGASVSIFLGNGAGSFGPQTLVAVPPVPFALAVTDSDRDGILDILVAGQTGATLLRGNGAGGFVSSALFAGNLNSAATGDLDSNGVPDALFTQSAFPTGSLVVLHDFAAPTTLSGFATIPDSVAVGDLNGDGHPDVLVGDRSTPVGVPDQIFVLAGSASGTLGAPAAFTVGDGARSIVVADFDHDGRPDLAVACGDSNAVVVLLNTTAFAPGGALAADVTLTVADQPLGVGAGDLDGNGTADVVAAVAGNAANDQLALFDGDGNGGFVSAPSLGLPQLTTPNSVAIADFNRDGIPDLATAGQNADNVSVLLGRGGGSFGIATTFAVGDFPAGVASGDFNRDGILDLAVPNSDSNNVSILLGNGAGGFGASTNFPSGAFSVAVAVGDLDRNGTLDLAVANRDAATVSVLLGNGGGGFGPATAYPAGAGAASVAVGDFNHDGKPDLAVGNFFANTVSILLGTGSGSFGATTDFPVTNPIAIALADMDRDGNLDVVASTHSGNSAAILLGNGAGAFGVARSYPAGSFADSLTIADFNRDGLPDVAVGSFLGNSVSVLLNAALVVNHAPVANAGADQTVAATSASGATVTLDGSLSSDPDGDTLTYSWSGPFGVASGASPSVALPVGTSTITLTVSDPGSLTATDTVDITVTAPPPPTPQQQLSALERTVSGLGIQAGAASSLNSKLDAALAAANAGNRTAACNNLRAFINEVNAQTGKKLTAAQAAQLLAQANAIRASLGCP
jgi:hypothetical protein